jgi:hypothetical protein
MSGVSLVGDLSEITFSDQPFGLSGLQGCNCVQIKSLPSSAASSKISRLINQLLLYKIRKDRYLWLSESDK